MGQYLPGRSPVHGLDPRAKLAAAAMAVPAALLASGWPGVLAVTLLAAAATVLSGIKPGVYWQSLKPLWLLLIASFCLQALFTPGRPLVAAGFVVVSVPGLMAGAWTAWRLGMLFLLAAVVTFTTTPLRLTAALEWTLAPLARAGVPVRELAMTINLALRFVPTLFDEARLLLMAQRSRGGGFTRGRPVDRARALVPFLVPLLINIFRRADELALAMEIRCYKAGAERSRMAVLRFTAADYAAVLASLLVLVAAVVYR